MNIVATRKFPRSSCLHEVRCSLAAVAAKSESGAAFSLRRRKTRSTWSRFSTAAPLHVVPVYMQIEDANAVAGRCGRRLQREITARMRESKSTHCELSSRAERRSRGVEGSAVRRQRLHSPRTGRSFVGLKPSQDDNSWNAEGYALRQARPVAATTFMNKHPKDAKRWKKIVRSFAEVSVTVLGRPRCRRVRLRRDRPRLARSAGADPQASRAHRCARRRRQCRDEPGVAGRKRATGRRGRRRRTRHAAARGASARRRFRRAAFISLKHHHHHDQDAHSRRHVAQQPPAGRARRPRARAAAASRIPSCST